MTQNKKKIAPENGITFGMVSVHCDGSKHRAHTHDDKNIFE